MDRAAGVTVIVMDELYTLENAEKFAWASITGKLNAAHTSLLEAELRGENILDAGCSGGQYAEFVARKNRKVVGVDRHAEFLQCARKPGRNATYVQGDITTLPFADKSFDSAYCFDVLEHVDDKAAICELARVTARRLILVVPHESQLLDKYGLTFFHYVDRTHLRYYNEASLQETISHIRYSRVSIIPAEAVAWNAVFQSVVEDIPTNPLVSLLDPRIVLRAIKYMTQNLIAEQSVGLKGSYLRAKKNAFFKKTSGLAFKQLFMEIIAVIDLLP